MANPFSKVGKGLNISPADIIGGAAIGYGIYDNIREADRYNQYVDDIRARNESFIPSSNTVNFPTGSVTTRYIPPGGGGGIQGGVSSAMHGGGGRYVTTMTGGIPHVKAYTISMPSFRRLEELNAQFGELHDRWGELEGDREGLHALRNDIETNLKPRVAPGFSDMRKARTAAITNARQRTVGDLREGMQRRRIAGSSFADDTITRAEAEFTQLQAEADAMSYLEEIDMTSRLIEFQRGITNDAAEILVAELAGQNEALAQQSANERFEIQTRVQVKSFNAAQRQAAAIANANIDAQNANIALTHNNNTQQAIRDAAAIANNSPTRTTSGTGNALIEGGTALLGYSDRVWNDRKNY